MKNRRQAFTLVEMMAVVVIIAILTAVIGPRFFGQLSKTEIVRAEKDIETIKQQVTLYRFDTNKFPEELSDLMREPDDAKGWNGPYIENKNGLKDPWGKDYQYRVPGQDGREFDIWSNGPDGQEGGEGDAADITSWSEEE